MTRRGIRQVESLSAVFKSHYHFHDLSTYRLSTILIEPLTRSQQASNQGLYLLKLRSPHNMTTKAQDTTSKSSEVDFEPSNEGEKKPLLDRTSRSTLKSQAWAKLKAALHSDGESFQIMDVVFYRSPTGNYLIPTAYLYEIAIFDSLKVELMVGRTSKSE